MFYVELGDPKLEEESPQDENDVTPDGNKDYIREQSGQDINENQNDLSEDEKIALLGKPRLGEQYKVQIRIKESREFKNTVDKLFQRANVSLTLGTSSWKEQFMEAITVSAGDDDDDGDDEEGEEGEEKEEKLPTCSDYVMHFITLFWKLLFALIPPADLFDGWICFVFSILGIGALTAIIGDLASDFGCTVGLRDTVTAVALVALGTSVPDLIGGWPTFVFSILWIGLLTAFVGDIASHFGCTVGLKDAVTAVSLVALGTSVPDTFASKVAAIQDKYADSSIGNVTGSNAVNVFLGIGIAWSIAAIYHSAHGSEFRVSPGSLAFSVTIFCCCAFISAVVLLMRRSKKVGGELGGPMKYKLPTTILFVGLWLFYVLMSSLEAYGYIEGF